MYCVLKEVPDVCTRGRLYLCTVYCRRYLMYVLGEDCINELCTEDVSDVCTRGRLYYCTVYCRRFLLYVLWEDCINVLCTVGGP